MEGMIQMTNRRNFIVATALGAGLFGAGRAFAQQATNTAPATASSFPLQLPKLAFDYAALEPHIDARTMEIHLTKHHAAYIGNMNDIAAKVPELAQKAPLEILANLASVPEDVRTGVRNNLGGHVNHTMFWSIMGPNGGQPEGELLAAINNDLGGLDKMKAAFNGFGVRQFGSGWVFVTVTREGRLAIVSRPNQDTPLMDGQRVLMGIDVWEHAYYLNYQNRRADYLGAWWNVVNWQAVGARYAAAKAGTLTI